MKGRFIVFEGIDGCGKTTQINLLSKWLPTSGLMQKGSVIRLTREPGGTLLGEALRDLLLQKTESQAPHPLTELLLYAADRAQHVSQKIMPALESGDWVISDRFSGSTIAYQGFGRQLNIEIIKQLEKIATQNVRPDITLLLKIPIEESLKRRHNQYADRIEAEGRNFLTRVNLGFQEIAKEKKWVEVQANKKQELVSKSIEEIISSHFKSYN